MQVLSSQECHYVAGAGKGFMAAIADFITLENYGYSKQELAVIQGIRVGALSVCTVGGAGVIAAYGGIEGLIVAGVAVGVPFLIGYSTYSYFAANQYSYADETYWI